MVYRLLNLPDWLEEYDVPFELVAGWRERGRRGGEGYSNPPRAIGVHHTAGGDSVAGNIGWQYHSSPDRPIGNGTLFRDGTYRLGCAGISNTQGKGGPVWSPRGSIPLNSGNGLFVSHEATNDGRGQRWSDAQIEIYPRLCAATIACLNADFPNEKPLTVGQIFAHFEWTNPLAPYGPSRKPDPSGPSRWASGATQKWAMDAFRGDVLRVIQNHDKPAPGPTPTPTPIPHQEDTMLRAAKASNGSFWLGDGTKRWWAPGGHEGKLLTAPGVVDAATATVVHSWADVQKVSDADLNKYLGKP